MAYFTDFESVSLKAISAMMHPDELLVSQNWRWLFYTGAIKTGSTVFTFSSLSKHA